MPIVPSSFKPPAFLRFATAQTILPAVLRRPSRLPSRCEELFLSDGDRLELEWFTPQCSLQRDELAIISHGLEGSTESAYVIGLANALSKQGYEVLAWNMRGCGSRRNDLPSWYHSGQSEDLRAVITHAIEQKPSKSVTLIGISVGGNIVCKYLGEEGSRVPSAISQAVVVSAPLDLRGSAEVLAKPSRALYMRYLLRPLRERMREKARRFPERFDVQGLESIRTFREFDARYTAPMHGFSSVDDYWDQCSGIRFLPEMAVPMLIITALDDPFLSNGCYPTSVAERSDFVFLETPPHGGHVGFIDSLNLANTWLEGRIVEWLRGHPR